jgi:hypothetical protein
VEEGSASAAGAGWYMMTFGSGMGSTSKSMLFASATRAEDFGEKKPSSVRCFFAGGAKSLAVLVKKAVILRF